MAAVPPSTSAAELRRPVQARAWCFTVNNPIGEEPYLFFGSDVEYAVWQLEQGALGTPHLQGYLVPVKRSRMAAIKKIPGLAGAHLEGALGDADANEVYCTKDEGRVKGPWRHGRKPVRNSGARSDITAFKDAILSGKRKIDLYHEFPLECAKYPRFIHSVLEAASDAPPLPLSDVSLRPWQEALMQMLLAPADDRKVIWVMDSVGNKGKTWFSKYLVQNHNAFYCSGGKAQDIALLYMSQSIVVFDFCRDQSDRVPYAMIEMFKNGLIFSPKYESKMKIVAPPHVVCFANFRPDMEKLSSDRWCIRTIGTLRTPFGTTPDDLLQQ